MKKILFLVQILSCITVFGQSQDQNYIQKTIYRDSDTLSTISKAITITYYDGLGRPIQQRAYGESATGKDIIVPMEYDAYGRPAKEYLPFVGQGASLNYDANAISGQSTFYSSGTGSGNPTFETTAKPFSEKYYEASPLNRVLKQSSPGEAWALAVPATGSDRTVKQEYLYNDSQDNVRLFRANAVWNNSFRAYVPSLQYGTTVNYHAVNTLYKSVIKDEDWTSYSGKESTTEIFKDKEGRVVLKRKFTLFGIIGGQNRYKAYDTYYVYDQFGNLSYVLPPLASEIRTITEQKLTGLCYQYVYDHRNRLVEKRLPGKNWEFMVYDKQDRLIASGPTLFPFGGNNLGWLITKYDAIGRQAYTGWYNGHMSISSDNRIAMQLAMEASSTMNETRVSSNMVNGIVIGYSSNSLPNVSLYLLTVTYYDDYTFPGHPTVPSTIEGQTVLTNVKGLQTGGFSRTLLNEGTYIGDSSYILYDSKSRPIRNYVNSYLGGYTSTDTKLDWRGKVLNTIQKHKRLNSDTEITVRNNFTYSAQERLLTHTHQIGSGAIEMLANNQYDELGNLIGKGVGDVASNSQRLQDISYSYNVRGWLKKINDIDNLVQIGSRPDLFAFGINYNQTTFSFYDVPPLYNGNIAETHWKSASDNLHRSYGYVYDKLDRLINSYYYKEGTLTNAYNESLDYDSNGNITWLSRNGAFDFQNNPIAIDALEYAYNPSFPNRLMKVSDSTGSPEGFKDDVANGDLDPDDDYSYDDFGNLTLDQNKGITSISYNHLNLPVKIVFGSETNKIEYIYDATGVKKGKKVTSPLLGVRGEIDYLNGFQYRDYKLNFFPTAEGYVRATEVNNSYVYSYVYNYKDHLGNIRMSYALDPQNPGQLKILEENNYYPFGLKHKNYSSDILIHQQRNGALALRPPFPDDPDIPIPFVPVLEYNYKYNGKEYQDELGLGVYDYGARNYDPAIGRWMNIDPLAETSRRFSPYAYALDNPVYFIDPDGMKAMPPTDEDAENYGYKLSDFKNGDVWTDKDGSWSFNSATNTWEGINGTNFNVIAETQQLAEVTITNENWLQRNFVFELSTMASIGVQVGGKIGAVEGSAGILTRDIGYLSYDVLNNSNLSRWGDGKTRHYAEGSIGIKGALSAGLGGEYTYDSPDGLNGMENGSFDFFGQLGYSGKTNFLKSHPDLNVSPGAKIKESTAESNCHCLDLSVGIKVLLGIEASIKIGIKK